MADKMVIAKPEGWTMQYNYYDWKRLREAEKRCGEILEMVVKGFVESGKIDVFTLQMAAIDYARAVNSVLRFEAETRAPAEVRAIESVRLVDPLVKK